MESDDDAYWRRPEPGADEAVPHSRQRSVGPGYQGPPSMQPPAPGWRPDHLIAPPPPRALPQQDHDRIEADEERARGVTRIIAISAGTILLVLMCALCGRWVF